MPTLKLWNGRLQPYKHGYIAAYSRADAVRLASEAYGLRGWLPEIRDYWSEGLWGNSMIGVTPRRGMFAETKDGNIVELVKGKAVVIERDNPEAWNQHQAAQRAQRERLETAQQQAYRERRVRLEGVRAILTAANVNVAPLTTDALIFTFRGHEYRIEETE